MHYTEMKRPSLYTDGRSFYQYLSIPLAIRPQKDITFNTNPNNFLKLLGFFFVYTKLSLHLCTQRIYTMEDEVVKQGSKTSRRHNIHMRVMPELLLTLKILKKKLQTEERGKLSDSDIMHQALYLYAIYKVDDDKDIKVVSQLKQAVL